MWPCQGDVHCGRYCDLPMDLGQTTNGESSLDAGHLQVASAYILRNGYIERLRTFQLVYPNYQFLHQDWRTS